VLGVYGLRTIRLEWPVVVECVFLHMYIRIYIYAYTVYPYVRIAMLRGVNPLTPNDLQRRRTLSPLKIKIPSKNMREKPTHTQIIHSVY
jgi:hypothetical protein